MIGSFTFHRLLLPPGACCNCRGRRVRCREPPLVRGCVKAALYAAAEDDLPGLQRHLQEAGDVNARDWGETK